MTYIFEPVVFFRARAEKEPKWALALAAPGLCVALQAGASFILADKLTRQSQTLLAQMSGRSLDLSWVSVLAALFGAASPACVFLVSAVVLCCIEILLRDSGNSLKIVELAAYCFFSQLPYLVYMAVATYLWNPRPIAVPSGVSPALAVEILADYEREVMNSELMVVGKVLGYYSQAWLLFLLGAVLVVVARLRVIAAATILLCLAGVYTTIYSLL